MPDAPEQLAAGGDVGDPYLAWARAQQAAADSSAVTPPIAAAPAPAVAPGPALDSTIPGTGIPADAIDPYAAWARTQPQPTPTTGPVTSTGQLPDAGHPSPEQAFSPLAGPVTSPEQLAPVDRRNAYGTADMFGGRTDTQQRADMLAQMSPDQQAAAVESMSPEEKLRYETTRTRAAMLRQAELEHTAAMQSEQRARDNADMQRAAVMKADTDTREMLARADQIANTKIDPNRLVNGLGTAGKIGTVLLSAIGGAFAGDTGGHNLALEQFNKQVENDIGAQHADIANQWRGVDVRRNAIAAEYDRHGDMYKAQETYRQAAYMSAINDMGYQLQQFDPAGGTALAIRNQMDQFRAAQQQQAIAFNQLQRKNAYDDIKARKDQAETEKLLAEAAKLRGALGAGAAGGASNPNYSVATGFFNPFTHEPVMGKRQIGGKGEDPKERNQVDAQISNYAHVQDYWQKLAAIGAEIGNAKSAGESVWKARKSTLGAEYDAAREALTVYLTKELGDKLTQGQLEAQAHRIPERASLFEARDPGKQLADAQSDADRDFARDMNIPGIDATPIIKAAQVRRGNISPTPEQALGAAESAIARDPTDKNAQAALADAHERVRSEVTKARERTAVIATAASITAAPLPIKVDPPNPEFRTDEYATAAKEANDATDRYGALLQEFRKQAAAKADEAKLGQLAVEMLHAKGVSEDWNHRLANEVHLRSLYERNARASSMVGGGRSGELTDRMEAHPGADPTVDVSRAAPAPPVMVPGVDALLPQTRSVAPPHPKGRH